MENPKGIHKDIFEPGAKPYSTPIIKGLPQSAPYPKEMKEGSVSISHKAYKRYPDVYAEPRNKLAYSERNELRL